MRLHLAARFHAFVNGLFQPSEAAETEVLHRQVVGLFERADLRAPGDERRVVERIAKDAVAVFDLSPEHPQRGVIRELVRRLVGYERMFVLPTLPERMTVAEHWDLRAELDRQHGFVTDLAATERQLANLVIGLLDPLYKACPALLEVDGTATGDIGIETSLLQNLSQPGAVIEAMAGAVVDDDLQEAGLAARLCRRLEQNLVVASGGNANEVESFGKALKYPSKADQKNPAGLVETYLAGTPLTGLFDQTVTFSLAAQVRFEHHHIVAGSGHGKTQTLQYLIGNDLAAVATGQRSVIVLDSQGDLIRNLSQLQVFAPGEPLHDRLVLIDPTDVEWPVSLNLFDVGMDRLTGYSPLERERLQNSILELYDFVLGTLLSAEMTQKQTVIFRYVTRLMLHIPNATIHTLRDLMEPGSQERFAEHIAKLEGTARHFFDTEFASKEFEQTKKQVLRRLWGILENQTFERMFSHPRSKLDLFAEMNAGKVILINTAKDLLKESGTEIFGRFFIALIAQAAQERATLSASKRTDTFVYIDEAQDYFDRNVAIILAQARKYNVGMVLAHQYLGQLDPKLQDAFAANTAVKFAGGVSTKDARALAPTLHADPVFIESQPKGSFAAHIRGMTKTAIPLSFPFGYLESWPRMTADDQAALQTRMRERYAVHYTELSGVRSVGGDEDTGGSERADHRPRGPDDLDVSPGGTW